MSDPPCTGPCTCTEPCEDACTAPAPACHAVLGQQYRALATSEQDGGRLLRGAVGQLERAYGQPASAPDGALHVWEQALAYRFVSWGRVRRFQQAAAVLERPSGDSMTTMIVLEELQAAVRYGSDARAHLLAYAGAAGEVLWRESSRPRPNAQAIATLLEDIRAIGRAFQWIEREDSLSEAAGRLTGLGLSGLLGPDLMLAASGLLTWGTEGDMRTDASAPLRETERTLRSLAVRLPEAAPALERLAAEARVTRTPGAIRKSKSGRR